MGLVVVIDELLWKKRRVECGVGGCKTLRKEHRIECWVEIVIDELLWKSVKLNLELEIVLN